MSLNDLFSPPVLFVLGLLATVFGLIWVLIRVLEWMDERGLILYSHDPATWDSLGNAFLHMQAIVEPQKAHILEAKQERAEEDGEAGPDDPTRHLRRKANGGRERRSKRSRRRKSRRRKRTG